MSDILKDILCRRNDVTFAIRVYGVLITQIYNSDVGIQYELWTSATELQVVIPVYIILTSYNHG